MFCLRARGQGPRAGPAEARLQAERAEGVEGVELVRERARAWSPRAVVMRSVRAEGGCGEPTCVSL
jgi:hypothetical protein